MASLPNIVDAVVIGGGPAGAAVGRLLAAWGHSVRLLTKAADPARGLAESLPPSTRKLLGAVGVLEAVEGAGFYRTTGNTVWWGSQDARVEAFHRSDDLWGYQVFRPDLDRLLLDAAVRAGADVRVGASVRRVETDRDAFTGVDYEHHGRLASVGCRVVLDCSGRAGVIARGAARRYEPGHRMQALIGVWHRATGWPLPDESQTIVETYQDGWAWSVPLASTTRHVGAMVDGATTRLTRGPAIADVYRAELAKTHQLRALMADATLRHVWACDASLYSADAHAHARGHWLLVGDAGSFIDPLSSFGVKKALASAWLAAIVVHTCLRHPERRAVALDFFSAWERQVYSTHLHRTRDFARGAFVQHAHPFWAARASLPIDAPAAPATSADAHEANVSDETLLRDPDVQQTFRRFQQSAWLDLAWADPVRFEKRALIRGREIVLDDAIPLPAARTCLRYLAGVDLVRLGEMACQHRHVPDLYEAYCRTHAPVSLPHLLGSLSVLVTNGILRTRAS